MSDGATNGNEGEGLKKFSWTQRAVLATACALVIGTYAFATRSGDMEILTPNRADAYYNLLVQGFSDGQLTLKRDVPPELTQLADPYDPAANALYRSPIFRMHDLSYYKGRLYLYFGVTPLLILFWPFKLLTGHYLFHREAVALFCAMGFLVSAGLLCAAWRRYFAQVGVGVVTACLLALGLTTTAPVLLARSEIYEVSISCGYLLTMLSLAALWCALHQPEQRGRWLAAASVAYGLAVAARPSVLFGAVILVMPVVQAWRERRQLWPLLVAAVVPIVTIGLGLMLYNALRFGSPTEFGWRYQLAAERQDTVQRFSLNYFWFNFRVYFLEPARWSRWFPFVREIIAPPKPTGHGLVETPYGVLANVPLVWLALAAPLVWRGRPVGIRAVLIAFLAAVALLFGICALTLCSFFAACVRYEIEFLSALMLLAVLGILGLERALVNRPDLQRAARWGWGLLLGFSVTFNLLAAIDRYAETQNNLGFAFEDMDKPVEAQAAFEHALRIKPDYAEAQSNLGVLLVREGRVEEGKALLEAAVQSNPDYDTGHYNLGVFMAQAGRWVEAARSFEQALRINPNWAEAHNRLAAVLMQLGRMPEAMEHWKRVVELDPTFVDAHNNLGTALLQSGRWAEAKAHFEAALRVKPDYAKACDNLARLLATIAPEEGGDPARAINLARRACELTDNQAAKYVDTLAMAYAAAGRFDEAIATAQRAMDLARAAGQTQLTGQIERRLELYRVGRTNPPSFDRSNPRHP